MPRGYFGLDSRVLRRNSRQHDRRRREEERKEGHTEQRKAQREEQLEEGRKEQRKERRKEQRQLQRKRRGADVAGATTAEPERMASRKRRRTATSNPTGIAGASERKPAIPTAAAATSDDVIPTPLYTLFRSWGMTEQQMRRVVTSRPALSRMDVPESILPSVNLLLARGFTPNDLARATIFHPRWLGKPETVTLEAIAFLGELGVTDTNTLRRIFRRNPPMLARSVAKFLRPRVEELLAVGVADVVRTMLLHSRLVTCAPAKVRERVEVLAEAVGRERVGGVIRRNGGLLSLSTKQLRAYVALMQGLLGSADLDGTGADLDGTGADLVVTGADLDGTGADLVVTGADLDGTGADLDVTGADLDVTGADLDVTGADLDGTGADLDVTGADLDGTGADLDVTGVDLDGTGAHLIGTCSGLDGARLTRLLSWAPPFSTEVLKEKIQALEDALGVSPVREMIIKEPKLLEFSAELILEKVDRWSAFFPSYIDAAALLCRNPKLLRLGWDTCIQPKLDFFQKDVGLSAAGVAVLLSLMTTSLEGTLRPRVVQMRKAGLEVVEVGGTVACVRKGCAGEVRVKSEEGGVLIGGGGDVEGGGWGREKGKRCRFRRGGSRVLAFSFIMKVHPERFEKLLMSFAGGEGCSNG